MKVEKRKAKNKVWEFFVGETLIATTKQFRDKKENKRFSLAWNIDGLLEIGRKKGMEGVLTASQCFSASGFFINYTNSNTKFSSKYVKKTIIENIKWYKNRG